MTTANTALRVTELDFDSIKANLKDYLRSQSEFQDFDFEGSGMSVLLDILAYNTHYMGYYLNMVANEMFLDTSQLRNSALSHAKMLGYTPGSRTGAQALINIDVTPSATEDQTSTQLTIDKYSRFLGTDINGDNYNFLTLSTNTSVKVNGTFSFSNVTIKQGEVVTRQYLMEPTNTSRRFDLPTANVDLSTISVVVQESISNTAATTYTLSQDITENNANSTIYFVEENADSTYTVYFGDGVIGKRPKNGSVINITYLDTSGTAANSIPRFVAVSGIGQYADNVVVSTYQTSFGGTEKETIEQIKFRAPYFYTTQNRAVTKNDYETLITKDFSNIDAVAAWGGEESDPPVYGKIFLSLKTKNNYALTNAEKEYIKNYLIRNRNVVTVTPEIVDPDFIYILIKGQVNYNPNLTSLTSSQLLQLVKAAVGDYVDNELNRFNSAFRKSKLQTYIDNADRSILGSNIDVWAQKRVLLDTSRSVTYNLNYNMELHKGNYDKSMFTKPAFQLNDSNSISRDVYFEETPFSATGVDSVIITNGGVNYFTTPTVTITGDGTGATATASIQNGSITKIIIDNNGSNYSYANIVITGGGGTGASAVARLENKTGTLRTYYYSNTGQKIILTEGAGSIEYDTGVVTLNSFRSFDGTADNYYDTDVLTVNFPINNDIILPLRNRILTIDENDPIAIEITMIPEA